MEADPLDWGRAGDRPWPVAVGDNVDVRPDTQAAIEQPSHGVFGKVVIQDDQSIGPLTRRVVHQERHDSSNVGQVVAAERLEPMLAG